MTTKKFGYERRPLPVEVEALNHGGDPLAAIVARAPQAARRKQWEQHRDSKEQERWFNAFRHRMSALENRIAQLERIIGAVMPVLEQAGIVCGNCGQLRYLVVIDHGSRDPVIRHSWPICEKAIVMDEFDRGIRWLNRYESLLEICGCNSEEGGDE